MIHTSTFDLTNKPKPQERGEIIQFLHTHLQEYGDAKSDISKAIDYALEESPSFGGFVLVSHEAEELTGVVVINRTGMNGYIPENILVYIATHQEYRGRGIGKALVEKTIELAEGGIALHVEPNNPARFLYEKFGFTNKYLEMRLQGEK